MTLCKPVTLWAASLAVLAPTLCQAAACQNPPTTTKLEIEVEGVSSNRGQMTGSLYPGDRSQFLLKDGALKVWRVPAQRPVTHMCIWLPGPGTYAFAVYHDENSNGKWDHNLLGRIEGFGFSNNPRTLFSPPSYDQVKFEARGSETTLHVRLRYP
ncbi:MAG TPA: DUF2141 domain-containing protein [Caulobacteraceae bacterium]|jgi:uncharacterized protein (DUF2141 family)